jgi:hypothetical protein
MEHAIGAKYCGAAFRHDVMKIVSFCLIVRRTRIKRAAERRKDWIEGAARAVASAAVLRNLNVWLRGHPQWLEGHPHRVIELLPAYFESLAAGAQEQAEKLRGADRGGRRPMIAFASLVVLLADTFSRVTGRKATITWNVVMDRYEGPFWDLLDVVLRDVSDTPS